MEMEMEINTNDIDNKNLVVEDDIEEDVDVGEAASFDEDFEENELDNIVIDDDNNFEWNETDSVVDHKNYKFDYFNPCKLFEDLDNPIDYFSLFFDSQILQTLTNQSNIYADDFIQNNKEYLEKHPDSNVSRWKPVTIGEIKELLAVFIIMGINRFPDAKGKIGLLILDHWKKGNFLGSNVSKIMSFNKYSLLNKFLHLSDNKKNGNNKILKYQHFYLLLKTKWNKYFRPGTHLTLDEGVVPFQGRTVYKQYMPAKPEKWGLKVYILSDSYTHYVLDAKLYTGVKDTISNYTVKLVMNLLQDYFWRGHIIFLDSYYCCPKLARELFFKDTFITGTVRANRQGMPTKKLEELKLEESQLKTFVNIYMHLDIYRDKKKQVHILSSVHGNALENNRPESLRKYNEYMNSVDKANQKATYYRFPHKQRKWWKAFFIQLLEISIVNAYTLYKINNKDKSHKEFRLSIVNDLLSIEKLNKICEIPQYASKKQHYFDHIPEKKKRYCIECKTSRTIWLCKKCTQKSNKIISLCLFPCFEIYHDKKTKY